MTFMGDIVELYLQHGNFLKNLLPTLNNEAQNKSSILKTQWTTEWRIFLVKTSYRISSYLEVREAFRRRFLEKDPPTNWIVWKNVKENTKENEHVLININKGRSGRRRTVKSEETVEVDRLYVQHNTKNVSCKRNGQRLRRSAFNKIMKGDLKWHPYQFVTRHHEFRDADYVRRF